MDHAQVMEERQIREFRMRSFDHYVAVHFAHRFKYGEILGVHWGHFVVRITAIGEYRTGYDARVNIRII